MKKILHALICAAVLTDVNIAGSEIHNCSHIKHFGKSNIIDVLGDAEKELYNQLVTDDTTESIITDKPIFL